MISKFMIKKVILNLIVVFSFFLLASQSVLAADASLSLIPKTKNVTVGSTFDVDVQLNTDDAPVSSVDVVLNYPADKLEYVDTIAGSVLPTMTDRDEDGTLRLNLNTTSGTYSGVGTLATITFKALKTGEAPITFVYVAGSTTSDSNVNSNNSDILKVVSGGSYTITATGSNDSGSGSSSGQSATTTPTPRPTLPVTGVGDSVNYLTSVGAIFIILSTLSYFLYLK